MKKQIIFAGLIATTFGAQSQNLFPGTGNTGIGTNNPQQLLDIRTTIPAEGVKITQSGSYGACGLQLNNATIGVPAINSGRNWGLFSLGVGDAGLAGKFAIYDLTSSTNRFFIDGRNGTGNIGIGTMSPAFKLDVISSGRFQTNLEVGGGVLNPLIPLNITQGTSQFDGIKFIAQSGGRTVFEVNQTASQTFSRYKTFADGRTYIGQFTSPVYDQNSSMLTIGQSAVNQKAIRVLNSTNPTIATDVFSVLGDGKTEINTLNTTPFRVLSNGTYAFEFTQSGQNPTMWVENTTQTYGFGMDASSVGHIYSGIATKDKLINFKTIPNFGAQVWIGDVKPQAPHTDFKLAVAGKIVAQSLYITALNATNWADYVFEADYKLPNLYDIEKYYRINKHLPEIPSAKEVEEKGIEVGEMNALLLKKIEELTIHMVEQQKQIDELKNKTK